MENALTVIIGLTSFIIGFIVGYIMFVEIPKEKAEKMPKEQPKEKAEESNLPENPELLLVKNDALYRTGNSYGYYYIISADWNVEFQEWKYEVYLSSINSNSGYGSLLESRLTELINNSPKGTN